MSGRVLGFLLMAIAAWAAAVSSRQSAADDVTATKSPPPAKAAEKGPFDVPEGSIEELQKYIEGLSKIHPSSSSRQAIVELHKNRAAAQAQACEKILAAKPTLEQAQAAVRMKVAALTVLSRLGNKRAQAKLDDAAEQAETLGLKEMVREVQLTALQSKGEQAAAMPDVEYAKLVARLNAFLSSGPIDAPAASLASNVALAAEQSDRPALARAAYRDLANALAASKDVNVAATTATMRGAARRLELVGKPFELEGSTVAGKPLDRTKYRGKVVLIQFFASWCAPCREEIPNIRKCYKDYHKRGFEVISVSIDRDRKAIEDFVEKEKYPWTVLLDRNEARGTDNSLATYYGIFTIPQMILVGADGKVVAVDVRGKQLGKKLTELLGP